MSEKCDHIVGYDGEDLVPQSYFAEESYRLSQIIYTSYEGGTWSPKFKFSETFNFCPTCGEKLEVVDE